jgi:hypothetical protein
LWDFIRGLGNVALMLMIGQPMARALRRFRRRFHFQVQPV